MRDARQTVGKILRDQAEWCRVLGSPLYAGLLDRAAGDVEDGGPCWEVLRGRVEAEAGKGWSALALRFMRSVHRLVLEGRAPELARHYPSAGGEPGRAQETWDVFRRTVEENPEDLNALVGEPCQTNEVGRSRALIGGFLHVARETGLPLRILEVGASAGLNLRWDHYGYRAGDLAWGEPASPVQFDDVYEGTRPPFDIRAVVDERTGCDLHPVDPTTDEGRLALRSCVWADQAERFSLLDAALEVTRLVPAPVERADATEWLERTLREPTDERATVVFHSVVMDQAPQETRNRIRRAIEEAGPRARTDAPLAWLRMEGSYSYALLRFLPHEVWLTSWPGGQERKVADTGAHGRPVRWIG